MKKFSLRRLSVALIAVGAALCLLGFGLSGFNPSAYYHYQNRWYSVIHID